jgi:hypothetical protein
VHGHSFRGILCWLLLIVSGGVNGLVTARVSAAAPAPIIVSPAGATGLETLAAREVRRYVYLRTVHLLPIQSDAGLLPATRSVIVVARKDRQVVRALSVDAGLEGSLSALDAQGYALKTLERGGRRIVVITGGDGVGTLYGAYRFAEHLGVRFYLHGEVIPDEPARGALRGLNPSARADQFQPAPRSQAPDWLPMLDEQQQPLFALRGIQPFHDFPEGPDWWNQDDYLAIIGQLPKLRMNFIGLHTYPEARPNAEPTVWIGLPDDVDGDGRVRFSYPASYQNTARGNWGYTARKTGAFSFGASQLFERDDFGAEVMRDGCPEPAGAEN